jgi:hypothetical protein
MGVFTSGGLVTEWDDQSGGGRNFTQGVAAQQPTFTASSVNGKPGITFQQTPTGSLLSSASPISAYFTSTVRTVFEVIKPASFENLINPELSDVILSDGQVGGYFTTGVGLDGGVDKFYANDFDGGDVPAKSGTLVLNTGAIVCNHKSGGNMSVSVNGGADVTVACGAIGNMTHNIVLGNAAGFDMKGDILEVLVWNTDIGSTNIALVKAYLNTRYAVY